MTEAKDVCEEPVCDDDHEYIMENGTCHECEVPLTNYPEDDPYTCVNHQCSDQEYHPDEERGCLPCEPYMRSYEGDRHSCKYPKCEEWETLQENGMCESCPEFTRTFK